MISTCNVVLKEGFAKTTLQEVLNDKRNKGTDFIERQLDFQFGKEEFFVRSRQSKFCAETYIGTYVAQAKLKIDAEIAEKNPFRMETYFPFCIARILSLNAFNLINPSASF